MSEAADRIGLRGDRAARRALEAEVDRLRADLAAADLAITVGEEHTQHWERRAIAAEADLADARRRIAAVQDLADDPDWVGNISAADLLAALSAGGTTGEDDDA